MGIEIDAVLFGSSNTLSPTVIKPTCLIMESIFTEIHLTKSKPLIVGILYRTPQNIDFVNCIDQSFI